MLGLFICGYIIISISLGFLIKLKSRRSFVLSLVSIIFILISIAIINNGILFGILFIYEFFVGLSYKKFENNVKNVVKIYLESDNKNISAIKIAKIINKPKKAKYIYTLLKIYKENGTVAQDIILEEK